MLLNGGNSTALRATLAHGKTFLEIAPAGWAAWL